MTGIKCQSTGIIQFYSRFTPKFTLVLSKLFFLGFQEAKWVGDRLNSLEFNTKNSK